LSVLSAWVFAGGSISRETRAPTFVANGDDPTELATDAIQAVGLEATITRAETTDRATEIRPGEGASHLGRLLHAVFEAPTGQKNEAGPRGLPAWLDEVGVSTRLRWVRTYVTLRATPTDERHGYVCQCREARSQAFTEALGALCKTLAPPETVGIGQSVIRLRAGAARELDVVPMLPETDG
jgi:hypothetical protein